jgi:hypothetical protein
MGNMYCKNYPAMRAQKFFELCQFELDPFIAFSDKDLQKYFYKMLDICYDFMFTTYKQAKMGMDE